MPLVTAETEQVVRIKGIAYPVGVHYREIIVTGPPCSGKTTLVQQLGGWPEEGYLDLASNRWWHSRVLAFRPREVHFGIPFRGFDESHAVYDSAWLAAPSAVDYRRIQIPPGKGGLLQINWRRRYVFDFQLPPAERILSVCSRRAATQSHPVDSMLSEANVRLQVSVYETIARHFQRCGMRVIVRREFMGMPHSITDNGMDPGEGA